MCVCVALSEKIEKFSPYFSYMISLFSFSFFFFFLVLTPRKTRRSAPRARSTISSAIRLSMLQGEYEARKIAARTDVASVWKLVQKKK